MSLDCLLLRRFGWSTDPGLRPARLDEVARRRQAELGLKNLDCYLRRVEQDGPEIQWLADELSVRETWFYRETDPLRHMLQRLWDSRARFQPIRVLSIPCASGEEPFTVLMLAEELGMDPSAFQVEALDLSHLAIVQAKQGQYKANSFRGGQLEFRNRCFTVTGNRWQIQQRFSDPVRFSVGNLLEPRSTSLWTGYDAVLCRNLLIYLAPEARHQVLEHLKLLVKPQGMLVVSACEASLPGNFGFQPTTSIGLHIAQPRGSTCRHGSRQARAGHSASL